MTDKKYDVVVIGAGAAGLIAAGRAAEMGANVLLLEKMRIVGKKLRITGKGRCNLTNTTDIKSFIEHFGINGRFLRHSLHTFSNVSLVNFLRDLGLPTIEERGGRVFPESENAKDVVNTLASWCRKNSVEIINHVRVKELLISAGEIKGVSCVLEQKKSDLYNKTVTFTSNRVILATGGASYPATGSTGDGYVLAKAAGHSIVPVRPSLTPLITKYDIASSLQGLSLRNIHLNILINNKKEFSLFGEMLFTHFGLSGPVILSASRRIVDALREKEHVVISIDLKPALDEQKLDARLLRDLHAYSNRKLKKILKGLIPASLIEICLQESKLDGDKPCHQITSKERKALRIWLKNFRFTITGYRPFEEAIITAGGVNTKEIEPKTMQSRLISGLYFAGEIMDIDADTGGYNLQAAFSTGWVAGNAASQCNSDQ